MARNFSVSDAICSIFHAELLGYKAFIRGVLWRMFVNQAAISTGQLQIILTARVAVPRAT